MTATEFMRAQADLADLTKCRSACNCKSCVHMRVWSEVAASMLKDTDFPEGCLGSTVGLLADNYLFTLEQRGLK